MTRYLQELRGDISKDDVRCYMSWSLFCCLPLSVTVISFFSSGFDGTTIFWLITTGVLFLPAIFMFIGQAISVWKILKQEPESDKLRQQTWYGEEVD